MAIVYLTKEQWAKNNWEIVSLFIRHRSVLAGTVYARTTVIVLFFIGGSSLAWQYTYIYKNR